MTRATVWPLHDNIQAGPGAFGQFLTKPREVDIDDEYWRARIADGSVSLHDPAPAPAGRAAFRGFDTTDVQVKE